MEVTAEKNERVAKMKVGSVYPHYVSKIEKKGRSVQELHQVIEWLTGYDEATLQSLLDQEVNFEEFFAGANVHPNAHLITGMICGYRIENISDEFLVYRQCRYMDKLVDELAKGRKMEKILRVEKAK